MPRKNKSEDKIENKKTSDSLDQVNRIMKDNGLPEMHSMTEEDFRVPTISSGFDEIDEVTNGGFPVGHITCIWGPKQSGKSSLAIKGMAENQAKGGKGFYYDLEGGLTPDFAASLGLNLLDGTAIVRKSTNKEYAETIMDVVYGLITETDINYIVIDSLSSLVPKAEQEGSAEDNNVGLVARILSTGLRKFCSVLQQYNKTLILISQEREVIGANTRVGMPTPRKMTGGQAVGFYASLILYVKQKYKTKTERPDLFEGTTPIGHVLKVVVQKTRNGMPFQETEVDFMYKPLRKILGLLKSNYGEEKIIKRSKNNHAKFDYIDLNGKEYKGMMSTKTDWESLLLWFVESDLLFDFLKQSSQDDPLLIDSLLEGGDISQESYDKFLQSNLDGMSSEEEKYEEEK